MMGISEEPPQGVGEVESAAAPQQPVPNKSRSPSSSLTSPGQEREALLARATMDKPRRPRSGSYGSRGAQGHAPDAGSKLSSASSSPEEQPLKRVVVQQQGIRGGGGGGGEPKGSESSRKEKAEGSASEDGSTLVMAFIVMIFVGTGNRVFMKLQTYPMFNYPFFLTMLSTFIYVPVCFMYIVPMLIFGSSITPAQQAIPKFKFAVMGLLDSVAGIMAVFAVNYIDNAAVIVLLQQAAIPISMSISKLFLGANYTLSQYIGASVVIAGIIVTLLPTFFGAPTTTDGSGSDATTQIIWSAVQVLSCIPMCLSSVYKEKALGDDDMDVIYLNGWVAVFQFMASLLFAVPSAYAMGLPVAELPRNTYEGYLCFLGRDSQLPNMVAGINMSVMPPDHCEMAPLFVSLYLCFNLVYNMVLIVILKYGSANVLFLASTVMVPIGNVAFSLKFVPRHQDLRPSDTMGLLCILSGLVVYRFSAPLLGLIRGSAAKSKMEHERENQAKKKMPNYVGFNQLEYLEPLVQVRMWKAQRALLQRSPEQIRANFMHRLGLPPSPLVSATPTSRGGSPYIGRRGHLPIPRASPGGYRASPAGAHRASPISRTSPILRTSPGSGYRNVSSSGYRSLTPGGSGSGVLGRKMFGGRINDEEQG